MFKINFAYDWIQTVDLWYQKQPLYQLSHNHCPNHNLAVWAEAAVGRLSYPVLQKNMMNLFVFT